MAPLTALSAIAPAQEGRANSTWLKKGQLCVLIVMHNTTERLLLKHVCQMEGCLVDTCGTGLKALQNMTSNGDSYALCLVDTVLPDIEPHSLISQMSELVRGRAVTVGY
jgi:PleD family two-component response regulator